MEEDLRVSQNPSPLGRWTWNLALPKPLPSLLSPIVCHRESTESSRDDIISLSSFLHIVPCLFLLKAKEGKLWQIFATLWCAARRGAAIDKVHWICFSLSFTNFVKMCRNLVKSGKKCETGEIYEVLEITVRTKSSCWQCARNFCISRCCPTVTWLSSLLSFLRFNWHNVKINVNNVFLCGLSTTVSADLALQDCLTRMKFN